jgi:hypothetical protein
VPTLYILFLLVLMPLLDVGNLFVAGAAQYLATNDFAAKAATQSDYSSVLNTMATEAFQFQSSGLAKFVNMRAQGGYTGCGDDLYVLQTDIGSGTVTSSAADQPLPPPIDTKNNMYEISVKSVYSVSPLVNLAAVPGLGSVPGLGQPVTLTFTANRPVEHPGGLQAPPGGAVAGGGGVVPFNRVASNPSATAPPTAITWRDPAIFTQIAAAGKTVVTVNVVVVPATANPTNPLNPWYPTGITVQPGQTVWIDTQATGSWGWPPTPPWSGVSSDANGVAGRAGPLDGQLNDMMLIGYVGANPPPPQIPYVGWNCPPSGIPTNGVPGSIYPLGSPNFIPSGNTLLNYPITLSGPISLASNDDTTGDTGSQMVRIIITQ